MTQYPYGHMVMACLNNPCNLLHRTAMTTEKPKAIDPYDERYHERTLWCVSGFEGSMSLHCITIKKDYHSAGHPPCVWGYSRYQRSPGFRTMGIRLDVFLRAPHTHAPMLYTEREDAMRHMTDLIPKPSVIDKLIREGKVKEHID